MTTDTKPTAAADMRDATPEQLARFITDALDRAPRLTFVSLPRDVAYGIVAALMQRDGSV